MIFIIYSYGWLFLTFVLSFSIYRYDNVETRFVPRPDIVANYHEDANLIDNLNQLRQDPLGLDRHWVTQVGNFHITTGVAGMTVVDVKSLSEHHGLIDTGKL